MKAHLWFFGLMACIFFSSCKSRNPENQSLFQKVENSGITFTNFIRDSKADNSFVFRNFYNGGGVAIGDINNDGLADVVLTSNMADNKLFLNHGNWKFEDISQRAGLKQDSMWSTGVVMVDVNGDGWLDIYICNSGHMYDGNRRNKLYINNQDLTFTESATKFGLDYSGYCTQASFFDYDLDGDLDCLVICNSPIPFGSLNYANMRDADISRWQLPENLKGGGNHLFRNNNGHFTEVTSEAGLHNGMLSFGLGVSVCDLNSDGYPDIYVGNDFIERDYLYINQRNGTFKDELESHFQQISMSSMSTDIADINNDGYPDILTTDMMPENDYRLKTTGTFDNIDLYLSKQRAGLYHQFVRNSLQLNNGNNTFSEISAFSGVSATDWSWGAVFFDADNDGFNDIFICNGINKDLGNLDFLDFFSNDIYQRMQKSGDKLGFEEMLNKIPQTKLPNKFFKNDGHLHFFDVGNEWGFAEPTCSNSVAYGDLDNDGTIDLVINNENMPASVYRNNSAGQTHHNFLSILLKGRLANSFAIGAKIRVFLNNQVLMREISPARGFQSSVDYTQVIGLGSKTKIDSIQILWPDGYSTVLANLPLNKKVVINEQIADLKNHKNFPAKLDGSTILKQVPSPFDKHEENQYVDFYAERNLPEISSREGPHAAVGDVNGDGLEDVYIGGASGQAGQLYLQTASGFQKKTEKIFNDYAVFEDVAVLFFDCDGDGDKDLFIGSGGNNFPSKSRQLEHRLYLNDGAGNFSLDPAAFPGNSMNVSVAVSDDFDGDKYQDLFVGGRGVSMNYGETPHSYLFRNDGHGHFIDVTSVVLPELDHIGFVTDATWADLDGDGHKELIVCGEWMAPLIFKFDGRRFQPIKQSGFTSLFGWWKSVAAADINGDGKTDLIFGNIGQNFYLKPDSLHPVQMWTADFDHDGRPDNFLTRTIDGKDMPVFLKRDVTDQFPFLKKENLQHEVYARKSIQDLFSDNTLSSSAKHQFNYCSSIIAFNRGSCQFQVRPLPDRAQLSSINAIYCADLNKDGRTDLITGGNDFGFPPQFGRLDASYGDLWLNGMDHKLNYVSATLSGLSVTGEIKDIKAVRGKRKSYLLILRNDSLPALFEIRRSLNIQK